MYSNTSEWVEQWRKSGDQGEAIGIDSLDVFKLKFVAYTGSSYTGDVAIDDVNITRRTTPAPSLTASPSITPAPTFLPWLAPTAPPSSMPSQTSAPSQEATHAPTTTLAYTASQFQKALEGNGNTISMSSDVMLSDYALLVSNVSAVRIFGNNFEVSGGGSTQCFYIENAELWISDLVVSNCFSYVNGGGMYIYGYSQVTLLSCTFSRNDALFSAGGAIFFDGLESFNHYIIKSKSLISKIMLRNCTLTQNTGGNGGAIGFNFKVSNFIQVILCAYKSEISTHYLHNTIGALYCFTSGKRSDGELHDIEEQSSLHGP